MGKKKVNETTAASKFVDSFFKGLTQNNVERFLAKAKKKNVEPEIIRKLEKLKQEKDELDDLINKYSK